MRLAALLLLTSCAATNVVTVTPSGGNSGPRVLCVFAHPDDETTVAGALYKTATFLDGTVDMVLITNGEGGFKYSTLAEDIYELELTLEEVGRAHLPRIRREEMLDGCALLGVSVESETSGPPTAPPALSGFLETAVDAGEALVFDRTQQFGHQRRLDYRVLVNLVIAQHRSQGTLQLAMWRGLAEHYFVFSGAPPDAHARAAAWMQALAQPQFPVREYGESAGTNAR